MIQQHLREITLAATVLDLGTAFRVGAWKAQMLRGLGIGREVEEHFSEILAKLSEFDELHTEEVITQDVEAAKTAALIYQETLKALFANTRILDTLHKETHQGPPRNSSRRLRP